MSNILSVVLVYHLKSCITSGFFLKLMTADVLVGEKHSHIRVAIFLVIPMLYSSEWCRERAKTAEYVMIRIKYWSIVTDKVKRPNLRDLYFVDENWCLL